MKKMLSLVVSLMLACSVFFAGCDKHQSDSTPTELPSDENNNSTAVQTPNSIVEEPVTYPVEEEDYTVENPTRTPDVIFVPTPQEVVEKMLEMAKVTKDDLVYDLGCGDGRIVVTAALKYGCKAVGYDIDPQRIKESLENVEKNNVGNLVTIEQKDIFTLDLSDANVITLYLLPSLNAKLIPQLEKLKPGSRIVSHDFDMRGVKPDEVVTVTSADGSQHTVYLWTTPLKKESEDEML
jgi:SAM-dependent methyltransferase